MSRLGRSDWRGAAAAVLLLVMVLTWVPMARANEGGSLTGQYPLGTQTLCCVAGSGSLSPGSTTRTASTPRTASARKPTRGHGGISILLVVAVIAVIAFAPAVFVVRAGFSPRGRGRRRGLNPAPAAGSSPDVKPAPDEDTFDLGVRIDEPGDGASAEVAVRRAHQPLADAPPAEESVSE